VKIDPSASVAGPRDRARRAASAPKPDTGSRLARLLWLGLAVAFGIVVSLGLIGFTRFQEAAGALQPLTTRLYLTLQLFVLESGAVAGPVPWELNVARILAPILAAYAVLRVIVVLFRDQLDRLRLLSYRQHVVVAGLGRKGERLAQALLLRGDRVVVIEADATNPALGAVRALGGLVVIGDARTPTAQRRARVGAASQLAVLCGVDTANIGVMEQARQQLDGNRSGSLHCVVHLTNRDLALLLCVEELERYGEAAIRVDFVNVYSVAAQALLAEHPAAAASNADPPSIAVLGAGPTARHLIPAIARSRASRASDARERPTITVVGMSPTDVAALEAHHPELVRLADVMLVADLAELVGERIPDVAYVCPDDDEAAATIGLELRRRLVGHPARLVVVLTERAGLAGLLEGTPEPAGGPSLATFGLLDEACRPEILLSGMTEVLARAMHATYLEAAGAIPPADESARPWADLAESLRESNRDQAAHIAVKLAAIGQAIGPLVEWTAASRSFADAEVETMAQLEHERWVADRRRAGWQPGPRDPQRRTTPYLVPWAELTEDVREKDRLFVRALPRLLASVGLQALRPEDLRPQPFGVSTVEQAGRVS